jgi:hypothetical protein
VSYTTAGLQEDLADLFSRNVEHLLPQLVFGWLVLAQTFEGAEKCRVAKSREQTVGKELCQSFVE